jgi:hypothetical protein
MQLVVYSSYQINKEYITSVFCINKAHPELHCDGKCFLSSKLKELEKKNQSEQENLRKSIEYNTSITCLEIKHFVPSFTIKNEIGYLEKPIKDLSISIFHPPKIV